MNDATMFGKYLRREENFWRIKSNQGPNVICYCKHSSKCGGIYAYIKRGEKGVDIITQGKNYHFDDFNNLSNFLATLEEASEHNFNGLVKTLYRSASSRVLRNFAL